MRKLALLGLIGLAGCGSVAPEPQTVYVDTPVYVETPVYVPVDAGTTYLDALRIACWWMTDADIYATVGAFDQDWYNGWTLAEQYDGIDWGCGGDQDCIYCGDSIAEYVYLVYH